MNKTDNIKKCRIFLKKSKGNLELKNAIIKLKNSVGYFNSRPKQTKERCIQLEGRAFKTSNIRSKMEKVSRKWKGV